MILSDPTPKQEQALEADVDVLVVGPPGSGKTTLALAVAEHFIETKGLVEPRAALFLSFSNAAVQRIQEAAAGRLHPRTRRLVDITTFHGLCHSVLGSHWRLAGLGRPYRLLPPEDELGLRSRLPEAEWTAELNRLEREEGRVRFDRFVPLVLKTFEVCPTVRVAYAAAFPLVIVDEYQDTSDDQDTLVSVLASGGQLFMLGDPEQRIYDFVPGTRPDRLAIAAGREGVETVELEKNHRSGSTDISVVARAVLDGSILANKPKDVRYRGFGSSKGSLVDVLKQEIISLETWLRKQVTDGSPVSVAIMAATNDYVSSLSAALLATSTKWKHPFRHQILLPTEAVAIAWDAVMTALEPGETIDRQVAEVLRSAGRLNRLKPNVVTRIKDAEKLERWASDLDSRKLSGRAKGAIELRRRLAQLRQELTGDPSADCDAVVSAFTKLPADILDQIVKVVKLRSPVGGISDLTNDLLDLRNRYGEYRGARGVANAVLLRERLETYAYARTPRILMTLHKCKGKQFDGVIIIDAHHPPNRLLRMARRQSKWDESRRLLHVAMTRARFKTIILTPSYDPSPLLPSYS